jgi:pilus assembly protein CpaE
MSADDNIMYPEFMAFVSDDAAHDFLRRWVQKNGWPEATVQLGGVDEFSGMLEQSSPPKLVMIDLDGQDDQLAAAARLVNLCGGASQIVGIGNINDVQTYRRFIQAGLTDYLVKPLNDEALDQILTTTQKPKAAAPTDAKEAKLVFIIGTRGGVGASTCAVNLSWMLAEEQKLNTALIDLDLQYGTASLAFDVEPGRGVRDIMSSPSRVDSLMIASSMMVTTKKLSILGTEENLEEPAVVDPFALDAVIKEIRDSFDIIVIDMPRHILSTNRRLLSMAHSIILISDQSLFGIRDCLRLRLLVKGINDKANFLIVSSRHGKDRPPQVDLATFERGIQAKIDFTIPEDYKVINDAANSGKPVASSAAQSASAKAIRKIAEKIADIKPDADPKKTKEKSGGWGSKKK